MIELKSAALGATIATASSALLVLLIRLCRRLSRTTQSWPKADDDDRSPLFVGIGASKAVRGWGGGIDGAMTSVSHSYCDRSRSWTTLNERKRGHRERERGKCTPTCCGCVSVAYRAYRASVFDMSLPGTSPAGCRVAHRRLETWARAGRERSRSATTSSTDSTGEQEGPRPTAARLARTPSVSSQSSVESGHRGSSPQIRAFGPDGRSPSEAPSAPTRIPRCPSPLLIPPRLDRSDSLAEGSGIPPASPLGALRPDLYTKREGPVFLGLPREAPGPSLGRLHVRLDYDFDKSDLNVHLIEAHDLVGFSDPYVRLLLVPEVDGRPRQTPVHRNEPDPLFDERFKFPVSHDQLSEKTLVLRVYDRDRYSRNEVTGEVKVALEGLGVACGLELWAEIGARTRPREELQELSLSLSYLPSAQRLTVVPIEARNLLARDTKDTLDPSVKVYLLVSGKRVKKKKTGSRKDTAEPTWNEALSFSLASDDLPNAALEICVSSGNRAIGWCCVGATESGREASHWNRMIQQPRKGTTMWHTLR